MAARLKLHTIIKQNNHDFFSNGIMLTAVKWFISSECFNSSYHLVKTFRKKTANFVNAEVLLQIFKTNLAAKSI